MPKVKWDISKAEAKKVLQQEKEAAKKKIKAEQEKKKPKKTIKKRKSPNTKRTKLKNPIWKECEICWKDFETYYEVVKLCSPECVAEYNSMHSGRPKADLEAIKEALKPYLQIGCSIEEATLESGICHKDTIYKYKKLNEKFADWLEAMQNFSIIKSKRVIYKAISNNDKEAAKWWLERKKPSEFAKAIKNDLTSGGNPIGFTMDLPPSQFGTDEEDED